MTGETDKLLWLLHAGGTQDDFRKLPDSGIVRIWLFVDVVIGVIRFGEGIIITIVSLVYWERSEKEKEEEEYRNNRISGVIIIIRVFTIEDINAYI